jgi:hypothetical protein
MTDLNRIGGGLKLLEYILKTETKNKPWSKEKLIKDLEKQPNPHTSKTRNDK